MNSTFSDDSDFSHGRNFTVNNSYSVNSGVENPLTFEFSQTLGRVNVILGTNGAGKSSLLRAMNGCHVASYFGLSEQRLIDGNRFIAPFYGHSQQSKIQISQAQRKTQENFLASESADTQAIELMFEAICQDHIEKIQELSESCIERRSISSFGEIPEIERSKLDDLKEAFSNVFPSIQLIVDPIKVEFSCKKNNKYYNPSGLSTGERQILYLLGKLILEDVPTVFLIDEPDRNLNAGLAVKFWTQAEQLHQDSAFVYATHNPNFALREQVDKVFLLQSSRVAEVQRNDFENLDIENRREYLGVLPSIVSHGKRPINC